MRVVIAPDSFKGSLPASGVAAAIAAGWRSVRPGDDLQLFPQADGGEGTLDAIADAVPGAKRRDAGLVTGPDLRPTPGEWLELPDGTAVVELAQMSGLPLMRELDAMEATTRGLGEVIANAVDAGATRLVVGLGGSASTDGGAGALVALGLGLADEFGDRVPDGGGHLRAIATVDRAALRPLPEVTLLTDVTAPLLGPTGAAAVFGPQKGADAIQVVQLDDALAHFVDMLTAAGLPGDPAAAGTGAAGGTGYGFQAAFGARIESGADFLAELTGLDLAIADADVLLSGEGRFDDQSLTGKVVGQLLERANQSGVTAGVIAGQVTASTDVWTASLVEFAGSVEAAMAEPLRWLHDAGAAAARQLGVDQSLEA
jgi:glycerate kinase